MTAPVTIHRCYTVEDAARAAEVLREASAGHAQAASCLSTAYGLDDLTETQMQALCDLFSVEA